MRSRRAPSPRASRRPARALPLSIPPRAFSWLALVTFISMIVIVLTGAAVRLTGSGLGCPDWPNCFRHQLTAPIGNVHAVIEDANRIVTVLLVVLVIGTVLAAILRRPRRRDLVWLSAGLVGGVVAEVLLGAIVVYTKLNPWLVSGHMALSLAMVVTAGVLHHRSRLRYDSGSRREVRCA